MSEKSIFLSHCTFDPPKSPLYEIRVDYPLYLGKGRGAAAGCKGEKTPELEKGVIKSDLVLKGTLRKFSVLKKWTLRKLSPLKKGGWGDLILLRHPLSLFISNPQ